MRRPFLALILAATAAPAAAQAVLGENPVLQGTTTCRQFETMDSPAQAQALSAIEPIGDGIAGADPGLVRQWAAEVTAACAGAPDRPLEDAARAALGAD